MNNLLRIRFRLIAGFIIAFAGLMVFEFSASNQKAQEKDNQGERYEAFAGSDASTVLLRSPDYELVRINVGDLNKSDALEEGTLIEDYGTSIVISRKKTAPEIYKALEPRTLDTKINLPGSVFEPLEVGNWPNGSSKPSSEYEKAYFVVQTGIPVNDKVYRSIEDAGVEIVQYIPHNAFLVFGNQAAIERIRNHKRVRWVGEYLPGHKLSENALRSAESLQGKTGLFDVAVLKRADFALEYSKVTALATKIISAEKAPAGFINMITAELDVSQLESISRLPHVFRIDPFVERVAEDERAAQIVAGNFSDTTTLDAPGYDPVSQFGVDGTNVTVSISDDGVTIPGNGGFYLTSANTVDGPLRGATAGADGGHGHINASIVAGSTPFGVLDPTGYNYGRGIAPGAHIINIPFLKSGNTTTDAQSVDDTVSTSGPNGVKGTIINNSWGAGTNGNAYDSRAALWDSFVFDASSAGTGDPINVVFSAGNCGNGPASQACSSETGLTRPKMAKNVIAVGNSENIRTEISATSANNMDDMRASSSRGPAADGRIKPDITAPGTVIAGSRGGDGTSVSGHIDADHSYSVGTSHAAPQIAGVAALFTHFWKANNAGALPRPSLVKAAILNSGLEMNGVGSGNPLPNGDEGWGRVNLKTIFNTGVPMRYSNEDTEISDTGIVTVTNGSVGDGLKPVRIALVWTDPPGTVDPALVNDLDLTVTVGSDVYKGNVFTNGESATGGTSDTVNNVEMVRLPSGLTTGTAIKIEIGATALNGDGIPGNADSTDQTFSLFAYNVGDAVASDSTKFDFDGDSKADISIFRPGPAEWWLLRSSDGGNNAFQFGQTTDTTVPADFTGDGKADVAIWRETTGEWFVLRSEDQSFFSFPFGTSGDIPAPGDYDGDGKADPAVFRPASATWFILRSSDSQVDFVPFGATGDKPLVGDYDNDGKDDVAIYRPSVSQYWINRSNLGVVAFQFGQTGDQALTADFTGDGTSDVGFWRPGTGEWFVIRSEDQTFFAFPFGATGDIPAPGDYDGDGTADATVFRPATNTWFSFQSTAGTVITGFGASGDVPVPSAYVTN